MNKQHLLVLTVLVLTASNCGGGGLFPGPAVEGPPAEATST